MFKYLPPKARTFMPGCQGRKGEEGDFIHCWSLLRKDLVRFACIVHTPNLISKGHMIFLAVPVPNFTTCTVCIFPEFGLGPLLTVPY